MAHETTHKNQGVQGKIVQCIGAVVDVEFPRDHMPRVYDALKLEGTAVPSSLSASYTRGMWSRGNSTSTTAPIH